MTTLADFRAERGLTLEQMAVELELSAKSRGWLSEIERGVTDASLRLALRIQRWSGGRVTAGSVCKELADHADGLGVGSDNLAPASDDGAENSDTNISRTSATALGDASTAERVADSDPIDGAVGGNAVVGSVTSPADRASTHRDIHQRLPGFASAGGVQLNGPEVGEANLDPARTSDTADRLDAETVTIADIDDGPGEGLARPSLGGHGAAIRNPAAGVSQGGRGDEEAKGERESDHAATVAQVGVAA